MNWLTLAIHWLRTGNQGDAELGRIRAHLEGDAAPQELARMEAALRSSDQLRKRAKALEERINDLRSMPTIEPPADLWEKIEQRLDAPIHDSAWKSAWLDPVPNILREQMSRLRWTPAAACLLLFAAMIWMSLPSTPNYQLIEVTSEARFGLEAESYVAHHDLAGSPAAARELLIAHYTEWPE